MLLDVNRVFSARLVYDESAPERFQVKNSFWDWLKRIIFWICSPKWYTDENRRTIACFKKCLVDTLGKERLQRICTRYSLDLDAMEKKGSPLLSRHVAQIVIGARDVSVKDVNEFLQRAHQAGIPDPRFVGKNCFLDLDRETLADLIQGLAKPFANLWEVPDIAKKISGRPTDLIARFFYDPFLADRERQQVCRENSADSFDTFMHNMVARVIKREMDVGTLIPAPNGQYYHISGKLVTGEGMVSYLFHPATGDTDLPPLRLFRGTSARNSEIDGISTVITDLEQEIGKSAYESGKIYEDRIQEKLVRPKVEGGHSMGATIVQRRLVDMDHIEKAYLFCGPGVSLKEVEKFNEKNRPVHLVIRHSTRDSWSNLGEAHIGYQAPPNVHIDFLKFHSPKKMDQASHVAVWGREKVRYGIEGGHSPEHRDLEFLHKHRMKERIRSTIGPLISRILREVRDWCRCRFSNRTEEQLGLKIGTMQNGRWRVDHFRPIDYAL